MSSSSIAATAAADDRVLHRRFDDALTALPTAGVDYATLTRVDVCYCKLTSIAALVGGGGAPAPLVAFVARHNQLDDSGVALLSRITTLQVVHLDGNQVTTHPLLFVLF